MNEHKRIQRAHRIHVILDRVAYVSLLFDIAIAIITLASVNVPVHVNLQYVLTIVNYGLTAVVVISIVLFFTLVFLTRGYNRIIHEIRRDISIAEHEMERMPGIGRKRRR